MLVEFLQCNPSTGDIEGDRVLMDSDVAPRVGDLVAIITKSKEIQGIAQSVRWQLDPAGSKALGKPTLYATVAVIDERDKIEIIPPGLADPRSN